jgi:hypothetical protein
MNYPEASFGVSENRLSPLSPLHKWRGEALRRGEAKVEASFEELNPLKLNWGLYIQNMSAYKRYLDIAVK